MLQIWIYGRFREASYLPDRVPGETPTGKCIGGTTLPRVWDGVTMLLPRQGEI